MSGKMATRSWLGEDADLELLGFGTGDPSGRSLQAKVGEKPQAEPPAEVTPPSDVIPPPDEDNGNGNGDLGENGNGNGGENGNGENCVNGNGNGDSCENGNTDI